MKRKVIGTRVGLEAALLAIREHDRRVDRIILLSDEDLLGRCHLKFGDEEIKEDELLTGVLYFGIPIECARIILDFALAHLPDDVGISVVVYEEESEEDPSPLGVMVYSSQQLQ